MAAKATADNNAEAQSLEDHFRVMELTNEASYEDVRKSYIRLAKLHHPDKNGDGEIFKKLNTAYLVIMESIGAKAGGEEPTADENKDGYFTGMKENKGSLTLKIPVDAISRWKCVLTDLYGPPTTPPGGRGVKYVAGKNDRNSDNSLVSTVHITVYHTGTILVQGTSFLLWHATCFPGILRMVSGGAIPPIATDPAGARPTPPAVNEEQTSSSVTGGQSIKSPSLSNNNSCIMDPTGARPSSQVNEEQTPSNVTKDQPSKSSSHSDNKCIMDRLETLELNIVKTLDGMSREYHALQLEMREKTIRNLTTEVDNQKRENKSAQQAKLAAERERDEFKRNLATMTSENARISRLQNENDEIKEQLARYKKKLQDTGREAEDLQKTKSTLNKENVKLFERLSEREALILQTEQTLASVRIDLRQAQDEIKALNLQLKTVWEEGVEGFETVTKKRDMTPKATATNSRQPLIPCLNAALRTPSVPLPETRVNEARENNSDIPPSFAEVARPPTATRPPAKPARSGSLEVSVSGADSPAPVARETSRARPPTDHLIVTSSLGRGLDYRRLRPGSGERVFVKPISGGRIADVERVIRASSVSFKSITVLAGGNDVSGGTPTEQCISSFEDLVDTVHHCQPEAKLNLCELPPRPAQDVRHHITSLNEAIKSLCSRYEDVFFVPVQIDASDKFFVKDRIHLSHLGTAQLALDIRHAIDPSRPTWNIAETYQATSVARRRGASFSDNPRGPYTQRLPTRTHTERHGGGRNPRFPQSTLVGREVNRQVPPYESDGLDIIVKLLGEVLSQRAR